MEANDMKAMREALALCMSDMCKYCKAEARACGLPQCLDGCETLKTAKAALAAPPRQCDVGTADEQYKRMEEYCDERHCDECPWFHAENCQLAWAQMPYEAEGGATDAT